MPFTFRFNELVISPKGKEEAAPWLSSFPQVTPNYQEKTVAKDQLFLVLGSVMARTQPCGNS